MIRPVSTSDAATICAIYNHYIVNTCISFEEEPISESGMAVRIKEISSSYPWLVWEEHGEVIGYAYAGKWKSRTAYRYAVESTVYLRHDVAGRGIGRKLYEQLVIDLRKAGMHCVVGCVALPNDASQRLHEKLGFKKVGHFDQAGRKFEQWIDIGYWQLLL